MPWLSEVRDEQQQPTTTATTTTTTTTSSSNSTSQETPVRKLATLQSLRVIRKGPQACRNLDTIHDVLHSLLQAPCSNLGVRAVKLLLPFLGIGLEGGS